MHQTAMIHGKLFFDTYVADGEGVTIIDIGAQDVNGSLRSLAHPSAKYIGVDFADGHGIDLVIDDPYSLPFDDGSIDVCVSSSCFEHAEFFWLSFLECLRVLKPSGLLYLNVPSNGHFHRYPVDCWRFFPDSGIALEHWAQRNGFDSILLESFVGKQHTGIWNDFVSVYLRDQCEIDRYQQRIIDCFNDYTNGRAAGHEGLLNYSKVQEDQRALSSILKKKLQRALGYPV